MTKFNEYDTIKIIRNTKYTDGEIMADFNDMADLLFDNLKKIFFPEEWISLDLKFSKTELLTMLFIDKKKEITMGELAEMIHSPMSTATGIVDRLVKTGYIRRERSEQDRRIVVLKLTGKGSELITGFRDLASGFVNEIIEDLTQEEKQFLTGIVLKVMRRMEAGTDQKTISAQDKDKIRKIEIE